jgi:hypothetical protein
MSFPRSRDTTRSSPTSRAVTLLRVNQDGKRDNQDGKFFEGVISEAFSSDLTRLEAI